MILSTLLTECRYLLDELTESQSHWDNDRLTAWLNEGQGDVAVRLSPALLPDLGTNWTCHLSNGTSEYTFTPEYLQLTAIGLAYTTPSNPVSDYRQAKIIPISEWNKLDDSVFWEGTTTYPIATIHGRTVYIDPTPNALSNNGLKVWYVRPPVDMSGDGDTPEVPQFSHRWLAQFAVYKALLEDGDQRSETQLNKYLENFAKYKGA